MLEAGRRDRSARQRPGPRRAAPATRMQAASARTSRAGEMLRWMQWQTPSPRFRRPEADGRPRSSRCLRRRRPRRADRDDLYIARLPDEEREEVLARMRALGERSPRRRSRSGIGRKRRSAAAPANTEAVGRRPKILAVASAVDLDFRYGCTPAWWQLWKGLHEAGCDLIVTPYRGRPVESPWWRTAPNPCYREGEAFARARDLVARLKGDRHIRRAESDPATPTARARGDLALGDAALAASPRGDPRARAGRGRGRRLHRPDEPPARDPDARSASASASRSSSTTATCR